MAKNQQLPVLEVTRETWWKLADALRTYFDNPNWTEEMALVEYGICVKSIITPLSTELVRLFGVCGGLYHMRSPAEFYALPAIYVIGCEIIEDERAKILKGIS